jgi:hypothetical protein
VIEEYIVMNVLFTSWDTKAQEFLKEKGLERLGMEGPVAYPGSLCLSDFHF